MKIKAKTKAFLEDTSWGDLWGGCLWPRESLRSAFFMAMAREEIMSEKPPVKMLVENLGAIYELKQIGTTRAELRCKEYPEICQTYNLDFVLNLIEQGLFTEISETA